jgi:hypothetical protein
MGRYFSVFTIIGITMLGNSTASFTGSTGKILIETLFSEFILFSSFLQTLS